MNKNMISIVVAVMALVSHEAYADWHGGRVTQINIGYEGSAITFVVNGWTRSNCSVHAAPNCLQTLMRRRAP